MAVSGRLYGCPVELSLDLIGGKWKTVILARLKEASLRYGELRRLIPELSDKVLTQRLRELEEAGFVGRSTGDDAQTRYVLTAHGRSLAPALTALHDWGQAAALEAGARFRSSS
jgi:DNA-binding HxlR family transcriptional regulator